MHCSNLEYSPIKKQALNMYMLMGDVWYSAAMHPRIRTELNYDISGYPKERVKIA